MLQEQFGEVNDCFVVFFIVNLEPVLLTCIQMFLLSDFRYLKVSFLLVSAKPVPVFLEPVLGVFSSGKGTSEVGGGIIVATEQPEPFLNQTATVALGLNQTQTEIPTVASRIGGL